MRSFFRFRFRTSTSTICITLCYPRPRYVLCAAFGSCYVPFIKRLEVWVCGICLLNNLLNDGQCCSSTIKGSQLLGGSSGPRHGGYSSKLVQVSPYLRYLMTHGRPWHLTVGTKILRKKIQRSGSGIELYIDSVQIPFPRGERIIFAFASSSMSFNFNFNRVVRVMIC